MIESQTGTNDVQQVQIAMRVLSRPNASALTKIYQEYGGREAFEPAGGVGEESRGAPRRLVGRAQLDVDGRAGWEESGLDA